MLLSVESEVVRVPCQRRSATVTCETCHLDDNPGYRGRSPNPTMLPFQQTEVGILCWVLSNVHEIILSDNSTTDAIPNNVPASKVSVALPCIK